MGCKNANPVGAKVAEPEPHPESLTNWTTKTELFLEDKSYLKLREVTLSYALPPRWATRLFGGRANGASLEVSGRNLVTWTKYEGLDPEVSNFGNQNVARNQDVAPFPPSRSFFLTVNVNF